MLPATATMSGRAARHICGAARGHGVVMWGDWGIVTHRRRVSPLEVERFLDAFASAFDGVEFDLGGRGSLRMDAPLQSRLSRGALGWDGPGRLTGPHGYAFRRLRQVEIVVLPWSSYMVAVQVRTASDRLQLASRWTQRHYFDLAHAAADVVCDRLSTGVSPTALA